MKLFERFSARIYLIILIILGFAVRFWDISKASIWHDEGFTMMLVPMSPGEIVSRTMRDVHPPLYYLVLHYWLELFGTSAAAARSLSLVCLVGAIPLAYLLVKELWDERTARIAALFVTFGPFLIRYSQEARMYGMVAALLLASSYALVRALKTNTWKWWAAYSVLIAAALYTHYYAVFMIAVHILYVAAQSNSKRHTGFWNGRWWTSNIAAALLFVPWLPIAVAQFTRVQQAFWIPKVDVQTMPDTLVQFMLNCFRGTFPSIITIGLGIVFLIVVVATFIRAQGRRLSVFFFSIYTLLAPVVVFALSLKRPIYVDRYFVFAAIGFYCLIAIAISLYSKRVQLIATIGVLLCFGVGVEAIHLQDTHQMVAIGNYVNGHYRPGDYILSGELYTFFDFSYYNHTGAPVHLWSAQGVSGYGESSLFYERADQIVVKDLRTIQPASGKLWVVGKPGTKEYYTHVPGNWQPVGPRVKVGDSVVQEYLVPRSTPANTLQ